MLCYCWESKKNMGSKKPNVSKTNKVKLIISSKCAVYNGKKIKVYQIARSRWIIKWLRNKKPILSQNPIVSDTLF